MALLDKEIAEINSFNMKDTTDLLIASSRKGNIEIFKLILQNIDVQKYIESDEEITNRKKKVNREKYKLLLAMKIYIIMIKKRKKKKKIMKKKKKMKIRKFIANYALLDIILMEILMILVYILILIVENYINFFQTLLISNLLNY